MPDSSHPPTSTRRSPEARYLSAALVAGFALACLTAVPRAAGGSALQPATPATPSPTPTATVPPGECVGYGEKVAPATAFLGDSVPITLTFRAVCGDVDRLQVVLVLDGSAAMAGRPSRDMKAAAVQLVNKLDLEHHGDTTVAVVEFRSSARRLCGLTHETAQVHRCIARVGAEGGQSIEAGIREARKLLLRAGQQVPAGVARDVMIVFSDGHSDSGCPPVISASNAAKSDGVLVISICVGAECDVACMRSLATSARYYFEVSNASGLVQVFDRCRDCYLPPGAKELVILDRLPAGMALVVGSADPVPTSISTSGDVLTWYARQVWRGMTFAYRVRPRDAGSQPTNLEARADFLSLINHPATLVYPVPTILVMPARTATPTRTPRPTRTPTATVAPTREPARLHLPWSSR